MQNIRSFFGHGIDGVKYTQCWYGSTYVDIYSTVEQVIDDDVENDDEFTDDEKTYTYINFYSDDGTNPDDRGCTFRFEGNPADLKINKHYQHQIGKPEGSGAAAMDAAASMLTSFTYGNIENGVFHGEYTATGLKPFSVDDFLDIMTELNLSDTYQRFVGLFDGSTNIHGTNERDVLETGGGNDRVDARAGDDLVNKWSAGNLDYDGGKGFDTLDFETSYGDYFVNPKVQTLVIDLKSGTGQNPFGGTLKLDSVEKVIGTDAADKIYGADTADWIETQDYGADLVKARGGNDTVVLWAFADGCKLDGGAGRDTLNTAFEYLSSTLDLTDPSKNTGHFANGSIKNFEIFNFSSTSFDSSTVLTFTAGAGSETVNVSGNRTAVLDLGDGNNRAQGGNGNDSITAGSGKDRLNGGGGDDFLTGGDGIDTFVFGVANGRDIVRDFDAIGKDHDRIDLSAITGIKNWADLKAHHLASADGNPMIETGDDSYIILTSVKVKNLDEGDFVFG